MKFAVVPSTRSEFVALARTKQGQLFRKEILRKGEFAHPDGSGRKLVIDDALLQSLVANFEAGICDIVQIPLVDDGNKHSEAPDRNLGEIVALDLEGDKLFATMDVRKPDAAAELGKTLLGASAMFAMDYTDTNTGAKVGPTLLHAAVTNRPHIVGLEGFRELVAASSDPSSDDVVLLSPQKEGDPMPTLEELLAALKKDHNIDVEALQAAASAKPETSADELVAALSGLLAKNGLIKLSATDAPKVEDVVAAVTQVTTANTALSGRIETLESAAREAEVDGLIKVGRILPAQRAAMIKLSGQDHELFVSLLPSEPLIKLSGETGANPSVEELDADKTTAEIDRLVAVASGKVN